MNTSFLDAIVIDAITTTIHLYHPVTCSQIAAITGCSNPSVHAVMDAMLTSGSIACVGIDAKSQEPLYELVSATLGHKRRAP